MKIFYLCDRRACEKCRSECKHTGDIRHAVNFELTPGGDVVEVEPVEETVELKSNVFDEEQLAKMARGLVRPSVVWARCLQGASQK